MELTRYIFIFFFLAVANITIAQNGTIRGTIIDDSNGESLIAVTVMVVGTDYGTVTDFDGQFELQIPAGTYDLQCSYISYSPVNITNIEVKDGDVTVFDNIRMKESGELLEEVVITAAQVRNTEAAIMTIQRKSPNLINGVSSQTFRKTGDGDAATAVKRVTGVTVEGGKYVYVRGLGDRYTKTMLNGMDIPGLDPDRNSLQIDIFPTNLIDNMFVLKSSLAELPADFTGGVVNIETKAFPEEKMLNVSLGLGYNPSMHFNDNYLSYQGGATDFLGFDDGTRALPNLARQEPFPSPITGDQESNITNVINAFEPNLGTTQSTSFMDYNFGLAFGDQITIGNSDRKLGYIFSATYKNSTDFFNDVSYGEYQNVKASDVYELDFATVQDGSLGTNNVVLGGLTGLAYKTAKSKYKLTLMHLQNGESKAGQFDIKSSDTAVGSSEFVAFSDNLEYSQRGLTNLLLNGKHVNTDAGWELDWRISPTISKIVEPDIRKTAFTLIGNRPIFAAGAGGNPSRIWRSLDEVSVNARIDFKKDLQLFNNDATLKIGASQLNKNRDYEILSYDIQFIGLQPRWTGEPDEILSPSNLWPVGPVYYQSRNNNPNSNAYNSRSSNTAGYVSLELSPTSRLRSVLGLRAEQFTQWHTGRDIQFANTGVGNNLDDEKVLDALDLFPSANLIYALTENQNLRLSYSRSIARPSFKELTYAQILDPLSNRIFNGALFEYSDWDGNLVETRINNFDLRWEIFGSGPENLSLSTFYKTFDNPIELVRIPEAQTSNEFQPRNVGDGSVLGVELEFGKSLVVLSDALKNIFVNGNVTLVDSRIEMTDTEFESRKGFEKDGQTISNTRAMAGQAPVIINAGLSYANAERSMEAGLFYNVKGRTLTVVGGGLFPDVFSEPFHSLNFNLNRSMGAEQKLTLTLQVENILNDRREEFYTGFQTENQIFTGFSPGMEIGLGVQYAIF